MALIKKTIHEVPVNDCGEALDPRAIETMRRTKGRFVYVIEMVGTDYIKIGSTSNMASRFINLQCPCPFELRLVYAMLVPHEMGHVLAELSVHNEFRAQKVRGEWFTVAVPDAIRAIKEAMASLK